VPRRDRRRARLSRIRQARSSAEVAHTRQPHDPSVGSGQGRCHVYASPAACAGFLGSLGRVGLREPLEFEVHGDPRPRIQD